LLVVTPPYNKPNTAGLVGHYQAIVKSVKIPVCLYHVPSRTGQMLTPEALQTVCRDGGVKVVKEASADVAFFSRGVMRTGLPFLSGDDPTYLPSLAVGGRGIISVIGNVFPGELVKMTDAFQRGDIKRARALHEALMPAIEVMTAEVNPVPLKAALAGLGLAQNVVRLPLAPASETTARRVNDVIASTQAALKAFS
jgi:4-hydroxy-tetrahydrodipicolinate synthase